MIEVSGQITGRKLSGKILSKSLKKPLRNLLETCQETFFQVLERSNLKAMMNNIVEFSISITILAYFTEFNFILVAML